MSSALARVAPPLVAGAVAAQVAVSLARPASLGETATLAGNAAIGGLLVALVFPLVRAMSSGAGGRRAGDGAPSPVLRNLRLPAPNGAGVLALALVPLAITLREQPARLAVTLYCFTLLAGAAWWVVRRRAGRWVAAGAVGGLAALALVGATADRPSMRQTEDWRPDSAFRWAVGWPNEEWRLRHRVALPQAAPERPLRLRLFLAGRYAGPARVYATVNGQELAATLTENELQVEVAPPLARGATHIDLVLRQAPPDPRLRLLASRWSQGATLGPDATTFSDSAGRTWLPGTFDDGAGRRRPGVLAFHLEEAPG